MKRIITLLSTMLLATTIIFAQQLQMPAPTHVEHVKLDPKATKTPAALGKLKHGVSNSRAALSACDTLQLDYSIYDQTRASAEFLNFNGGSGAPSLLAGSLTSFVDSLYVGYDTYIGGIFDSLAYVDVNGNTQFIPMGAATTYIDSLGFEGGIYGDPSKMLNDSLVFQIYSTTPNSTGWQLSANPIKTIVLTDTNQLSQFFPPNGPGYVTYAQIPIKQQLGQGQGFVVYVYYLNKDTSSSMDFIYSFPDSCGTSVTVTSGSSSGQLPTAYPSYLGEISLFGEIDGTGATILDGPYTVTNANNQFGYFSYNAAPNNIAVNCLYEQIQELFLFPIIDVCTNYAVTISPVAPSTTIACPTDQVNLSASVYGTNTPPNDLSYNWSVSSNGLLATTNGSSTNQLTMGVGNVTVTLTVTDNDNNSATVVDSIVIVNAAPTITIDIIDSDYSIPCTSASNLVAHSSGSTLAQAGLSYAWSDGSTASSIKINQQTGFPKPYDYAGDYTLTVTNVYGCSSTATATITYSNGVTNNVSFNIPTPNVFDKEPQVFVNTSSSFEVPWVATFDQDNTGNFTTISTGSPDITVTYGSAGTYVATLIMDSAGCKFASSKTFQVKNTVGISDLAFDNNVTLVPNPSNGNVVLTVNGVEKSISIQVYNIVGEEVKNFSASDVGATYTKSYDFSDLASGAYMVKVQSGNQIAVKKLLISK